MSHSTPDAAPADAHRVTAAPDSSGRPERPYLLPWCVAGGFVLAWLLPLRRAWEIAPDLGHAWVAPLLIAYLYWERWDERPAPGAPSALRTRWWLFAGALVMMHAGLRLFLTPFPVWPAMLSAFTVTLVVAGLATAWLVGGRAAMRWIAGPLVLVLAVLPAPTFVDLHLIGPLRAWMATLAAEICNLLGRPALASGTSVRLAQSWVGIDEACGGIRSLQACLMIALFFGEWYRFAVIRRFALILAGCAAALFGNGVRVIFLSLRADAGATAVETAHDLAGWLAMGTSVVLTGWLAARWAGYRLPQQRHSPRPPAPASASSAWRWGAVVVACFLTSEAGVRIWFARGEIARGDVPQWSAQLPTERPTFRREPLSAPAREMLGPDEFIAGTWPLGRDRLAATYYIEWHRGQTARTAPFLHNPTVCLPFSGCELTQTLAPITVAWSGGEIPFFAYKFRRLGEHILVAFTIWDPSRGRVLAASDTHGWAAWFNWRWTEVREARQHQPAQLLAISIPWDEDAPAEMRALLAQLVQPVSTR